MVACDLLARLESLEWGRVAFVMWLIDESHLARCGLVLTGLVHCSRCRHAMLSTLSKQVTRLHLEAQRLRVGCTRDRKIC